MNRRATIIIAACSLYMMGAGAWSAAWADAPQWSDPIRSEWFKSLRNKDNVSCCDMGDGARVDPGDVRQQSDGSWQVRRSGIWESISEDIVVREPVTIDGDAYIFTRYDGGIRCFIPPAPGY